MSLSNSFGPPPFGPKKKVSSPMHQSLVYCGKVKKVVWANKSGSETPKNSVDPRCTQCGERHKRMN